MARPSQKEVLSRIEGLNDETARAVICALVGHSKVIDICFGQVTCNRCGEILGDTLIGCYDTTDKVVVNHACDTCRDNYKKLDWHSKLMTPYKF